MRQVLELRQTLRLTITPQLQQAIRLLQLPAADLRMEIEEALRTNPMLEEGDVPGTAAYDSAADTTGTPETAPSPGSDGGADGADTEAEAGGADLDFEPAWDEGPDVSISGGAGDGEGDAHTPMDARSGAPESLRDHLTWQMRMTPLSDNDRRIAQTIIDAINDDGYLAETLDSLQETLRGESAAEMDEIEAVLHQIQNFDPPGVGARSLSECLLLQLRELPADTPFLEQARVLAASHLETLAARDYTRLRRLLGVRADDLPKVTALIQSLQPRPGSTVTPARPEYVVPDIVVRRVRGRWRVELNPDSVPPVRINRLYASLIGRRSRGGATRPLAEQLNEARWFLRSLRHRNETLLRVARAILERQEDFFERGDEAMRPMVLHDIAAVLGMHESTVSRATTNKYMTTPRGLFELKYFFSSHVSTADGGACSATAIRSHIRKLVEQEPPGRPISDSQIADILAERGINVARRTVAKYRELMRIPPSNQRRSIA